MKTVAVWRSEEKEFEDFLPQIPSDCFRAFANQYSGFPCTIKLQNGETIECVLVELPKHSQLLAVRRQTIQILLIKTAHIVSIAIR